MWCLAPRAIRQGSRSGSKLFCCLHPCQNGFAGRKAGNDQLVLRERFRATFPRIRFCEGELVTRDGRLFTSAAFTASVDLALQLIEYFAGPALALSCAKVMLIDANRESQFPFMTLQARAKHSDNLVLQAQSYIRSRVREDLTVENLAARLGVSTPHAEPAFSPGARVHAYAVRTRSANRRRQAAARNDGSWFRGNHGTSGLSRRQLLPPVIRAHDESFAKQIPPDILSGQQESSPPMRP